VAGRHVVRGHSGGCVSGARRAVDHADSQPAVRGIVMASDVCRRSDSDTLKSQPPISMEEDTTCQHTGNQYIQDTLKSPQRKLLLRATPSLSAHTSCIKNEDAHPDANSRTGYALNTRWKKPAHAAGPR
jgi:hypothetical protein